MKVGFYHVDHVRSWALYAGDFKPRERIHPLIASIRRAMPGVPIVHLTDLQTCKIAGVDEVVRAFDAPLALGCVRAYASCEGEWLFVDTDVIVQQDVRHVFEAPFDIAVATRDGTLKPDEVGTKFMARMPYNKGAVFSRSPAFWQSAVERLEGMSVKQQAWMGDQLAMCETIQSSMFMVRILPNRYNYPPHQQFEDLRDKAILHFKGPRKVWIRA